MSHTATLVAELTVLVLAIFLGIEVISKVPTMLHTPLMSGTNAIHGIVIVGAMLVAGLEPKDTLTTIIGATDLPSSTPLDASRLYARNVLALLEHLAPEGELVVDFDDEITAAACVTRHEVRA